MNELKQLVFTDIRDFDLDQIMNCGQCFRWSREDDGSYSGIISDAFANVSFIPKEGSRYEGRLRIWSNLLPESHDLRVKFWRNYLDLDKDYGRIKLLLSTEDSVMRKAIKAGEGLRILNQDKWETLVTFIVSQNNNIPRIKKCVESLCTNFGERIGKLHGEYIYGFPSIETLAKTREEELAPCRLGYRARYIAEAARQVAFDGGALLSTGDKVETSKIEKYLLSLSGVGPKVAHCVMLFSMKKSEAFPIDVWVRRVMNRLYGMSEDNLSAMRDYAERNFGELGGIAQQYLFNYIRDIATSNPRLYKRLNFEEPPSQNKVIDQ